MEESMKKRLSLSTLLLTVCVSATVFAQSVIFQGRVVNVVDGDTVTVLTQSNTEFQVRCRAINAPKNVDDFASESKQRLTELLLDEPVTVRDIRREANGTIAGTIIWNGLDVCLDQVRAGLARYDDQDDQRRSTRQQYSVAQAGARNNRFGLWSAAAADANASTAKSSVEQPQPATPAADTTIPNSPNPSVNVRGYFRKNGTYVAGYRRAAPDESSSNNFSAQGNRFSRPGTGRQSRWVTALKWIGIGAALGAAIYVQSRYGTTPTTNSLPMARCNDGSISYSQQRRGTCSHHGGVAVWLR
jgi:endonuclease YncB( thermonuclease family)